jgi:hypothetical protein
MKRSLSIVFLLNTDQGYSMPVQALNPASQKIPKELLGNTAQ